MKKNQVDGVILSSVVNHSDELTNFVKSCKNGIEMSSDITLPLSSDYQTPETLGQDRLANASALATLAPESNSLCIDIGTCIKFDFVNSEGRYKGGSIGPGLAMRFKSLNTFTDKLPLIDLQSTSQLIGNDTKSSILSGVFYGMLAEINGMIDSYQSQHKELKIYLTGGDASFFENEVKASATLPALYVDGIAESKNGAWPCGLTGKYEPDYEELKTYAFAARNHDSFESYMKGFLNSENLQAAQ